MTMEEDQPVCEVTTQTKCDLTANQSKSIMSWSGVWVEQQTELQLIRKRERRGTERKWNSNKYQCIVCCYDMFSKFLHFTEWFLFSSANTNNDVLPNFVHNQQKCVDWPVKKVNYGEWRRIMINICLHQKYYPSVNKPNDDQIAVSTGEKTGEESKAGDPVWKILAKCLCPLQLYHIHRKKGKLLKDLQCLSSYKNAKVPTFRPRWSLRLPETNNLFIVIEDQRQWTVKYCSAARSPT